MNKHLHIYFLWEIVFNSDLVPVPEREVAVGTLVVPGCLARGGGGGGAGGGLAAGAVHHLDEQLGYEKKSLDS